MKLALAIVLLTLGQLFAQDAPKPTVKECRANLKQWIPLFRNAFASPACNTHDGDGSPACPFAAGLRTMSTDELLDIPPLAEACIAVDRHHKGYAWSVTRASNIIVMRATYFLDDTGQLDAYARWEQKQRGISPAPSNSDEPDTVSQRQ
ncbi:MAG: hypothetical protein WA182_13840 [Candidatus Sulfotelmatobacter sp.]